MDKLNIYRILGFNIFVKEDEDVDMIVFNEGYVLIILLKMDRIDYKKIEKLFNL